MSRLPRLPFEPSGRPPPSAPRQTGPLPPAPTKQDAASESHRGQTHSRPPFPRSSPIVNASRGHPGPSSGRPSSIEPPPDPAPPLPKFMVDVWKQGSGARRPPVQEEKFSKTGASRDQPASKPSGDPVQPPVTRFDNKMITRTSSMEDEKSVMEKFPPNLQQSISKSPPINFSAPLQIPPMVSSSTSQFKRSESQPGDVEPPSPLQKDAASATQPPAIRPTCTEVKKPPGVMESTPNCSDVKGPVDLKTTDTSVPVLAWKLSVADGKMISMNKNGGEFLNAVAEKEKKFFDDFRHKRQKMRPSTTTAVSLTSRSEWRSESLMTSFQCGGMAHNYQSLKSKLNRIFICSRCDSGREQPLVEWNSGRTEGHIRKSRLMKTRRLNGSCISKQCINCGSKMPSAQTPAPVSDCCCELESDSACSLLSPRTLACLVKSRCSQDSTTVDELSPHRVRRVSLCCPQNDQKRKSGHRVCWPVGIRDNLQIPILSGQLYPQNDMKSFWDIIEEREKVVNQKLLFQSSPNEEQDEMTDDDIREVKCSNADMDGVVLLASSEIINSKINNNDSLEEMKVDEILLEDKDRERNDPDIIIGLDSVQSQVVCERHDVVEDKICATGNENIVSGDNDKKDEDKKVSADLGQPNSDNAITEEKNESSKDLMSLAIGILSSSPKIKPPAETTKEQIISYNQPIVTENKKTEQPRSDRRRSSIELSESERKIRSFFKKTFPNCFDRKVTPELPRVDEPSNILLLCGLPPFKSDNVKGSPETTVRQLIVNCVNSNTYSPKIFPRRKKHRDHLKSAFNLMPARRVVVSDKNSSIDSFVRNHLKSELRKLSIFEPYSTLRVTLTTIFGSCSFVDNSFVNKEQPHRQDDDKPDCLSGSKGMMNQLFSPTSGKQFQNSLSPTSGVSSPSSSSNGGIIMVDFKAPQHAEVLHNYITYQPKANEVFSQSIFSERDLHGCRYWSHVAMSGQGYHSRPKQSSRNYDCICFNDNNIIPSSFIFPFLSASKILKMITCTRKASSKSQIDPTMIASLERQSRCTGVEFARSDLVILKTATRCHADDVFVSLRCFWDDYDSNGILNFQDALCADKVTLKTEDEKGDKTKSEDMKTEEVIKTEDKVKTEDKPAEVFKNCLGWQMPWIRVTKEQKHNFNVSKMVFWVTPLIFKTEDSVDQPKTGETSAVEVVVSPGVGCSRSDGLTVMESADVCKLFETPIEPGTPVAVIDKSLQDLEGPQIKSKVKFGDASPEQDKDKDKDNLLDKRKPRPQEKDITQDRIAGQRTGLQSKPQPLVKPQIEKRSELPSLEMLETGTMIQQPKIDIVSKEFIEKAVDVIIETDTEQIYLVDKNNDIEIQKEEFKEIPPSETLQTKLTTKTDTERETKSKGRQKTETEKIATSETPTESDMKQNKRPETKSETSSRKRPAASWQGLGSGKSDTELILGSLLEDSGKAGKRTVRESPKGSKRRKTTSDADTVCAPEVANLGPSKFSALISEGERKNISAENVLPPSLRLVAEETEQGPSVNEQGDSIPQGVDQRPESVPTDSKKLSEIINKDQPDEDETSELIETAVAPSKRSLRQTKMRKELKESAVLKKTRQSKNVIRDEDQKSSASEEVTQKSETVKPQRKTVKQTKKKTPENTPEEQGLQELEASGDNPEDKLISEDKAKDKDKREQKIDADLGESSAPCSMEDKAEPAVRSPTVPRRGRPPGTVGARGKQIKTGAAADKKPKSVAKSARGEKRDNSPETQQESIASQVDETPTETSEAKPVRSPSARGRPPATETQGKTTRKAASLKRQESDPGEKELSQGKSADEKVPAENSLQTVKSSSERKPAEKIGVVKKTMKKTCSKSAEKRAVQLGESSSSRPGRKRKLIVDDDVEEKGKESPFPSSVKLNVEIRHETEVVPNISVPSPEQLSKEELSNDGVENNERDLAEGETTNIVCNTASAGFEKCPEVQLGENNNTENSLDKNEETTTVSINNNYNNDSNNQINVIINTIDNNNLNEGVNLNDSSDRSSLRAINQNDNEMSALSDCSEITEIENENPSSEKYKIDDLNETQSEHKINLQSENQSIISGIPFPNILKTLLPNNSEDRPQEEVDSSIIQNNKLFRHQTKIPKALEDGDNPQVETEDNLYPIQAPEIKPGIASRQIGMVTRSADRKRLQSSSMIDSDKVPKKQRK